MNAGREAYHLLLALLGPRVRVGMTKKEIVTEACKLLEADDWTAGRTRVEETVRKRSGWATYHAIEERAQELHLKKFTHEGNAHLMASLQTARAILCERYGPESEFVKAQDWAIQQLGG